MSTLAPPTPIPAETFQPYVPADRHVPEMTLKAIVLGLVLAVVLGAANAYVGLRIGLTVSAAIPAAVISMGILRLFRSHTILENMTVQTIASAGEALAAGVIFTIPAFVLAGHWTTVEVLPTFLIAAFGGTLGVLFTIPLRRAYIIEAKLPFPEGTACAEVLEVGEQGGSGVKFLTGGLIASGAYSFTHLGLRLWGSAVEGAVRVGNAVAYLGTNLAPILLGVGYIVGLRISVLIAAGGALAWFVLIPAFMFLEGYPTGAGGAPLDPVTAAYAVWSAKIRLVGGGAMITGGLYTLWRTRASLANAFREMRSLRSAASADAGADARPRTERDIRLNRVVPAIGVLMVGVFGVFYLFTGSLAIAGFASVAAALAGFFFSAVAGYMAGIVGSSNNPISGVTIVTLIFTALLVLGLTTLLGIPLTPAAGFAAALGVGAVIACSAAMAGDNLQDLKTAYLVGATPWKQQLGLCIGVVATAVVAAPTIQLLHEAYTLGSADLVAPQATLMSNILNGIFAETLDWNLILLGMAIGVGLVLLRLPVMAVAVGLYLPFLLSVPILVGGVIHHVTSRALTKRRPDGFVPGDEGSAVVAKQPTPETKAHAELEGNVHRNGLLFASGLIAGEAILGVLVAPLLVAGIEPALFAPLVFGLLAAGGIAVFGAGSAVAPRDQDDPRVVRGKFRRPGLLAGFVAVVGALVSAGLYLTGATYGFHSTINWPGLLVLAYLAVLLAYVPAREMWVKRG